MPACAVLGWLLVAIVGCDHRTEAPTQAQAAHSAVPNMPKPQPSPSTDQPQLLVTYFDFGEVSLDDGAVRLEHEFVVRNDSQEAATVTNVVTSCGCVKGEVAKAELKAGESTTLTAAIEVKGVGATEHSATVIFSNGAESRYWLRAIGTRSTQLHVVPSRHRITNSSSSIRMTLQTVDRVRGRMEQGPPTARIGEQELPVTFDKWVVFEARNELMGRPLRQTTEIEIDLSGYRGSFPAVVEIATPSGLVAKITVDKIA